MQVFIAYPATLKYSDSKGKVITVRNEELKKMERWKSKNAISRLSAGELQSPSVASSRFLEPRTAKLVNSSEEVNCFYVLFRVVIVILL